MWLTFLTGAWLLSISIMDVRSRRVPVWLLLLGGIPCLAAEICREGGGFSIVLGSLPGLLLLATAFATKKAGYGDGIVLLILGVALGYRKSLLLFGVSLFLVSICSLVLLVIRKAGRDTRIPFLPFLSVAWLILLKL